MSMWKHALLEIYCLERNDCNEWPEGTPSNWIEKGLVSYRDGQARDYMLLAIPLRRLLWWTVRDVPARARRWAWKKRRHND